MDVPKQSVNTCLRARALDVRLWGMGPWFDKLRPALDAAI